MGLDEVKTNSEFTAREGRLIEGAIASILPLTPFSSDPTWEYGPKLIEIERVGAFVSVSVERRKSGMYGESTEAVLVYSGDGGEAWEILPLRRTLMSFVRYFWATWPPERIRNVCVKDSLLVLQFDDEPTVVANDWRFRWYASRPIKKKSDRWRLLRGKALPNP